MERARRKRIPSARLKMSDMQQRKDRFEVKTFDCRPDGRIKPNALMQYLQEAAARHAEQLGFGFADLDRQDCYWVLANLRLEMEKTPRWGDILVVKTWPSGSSRLLATREFIGEGPDGRELMRAASEWMILDKHRTRPRDLRRLDLKLPPTGPKALSVELRRLQPADGYTPADSLRVPFSALDFNGHVNNTEYVRWVADALYRHLGRLPDIRSLQVTYLAEVFEGDQAEILVQADREERMGALIRRPDNEGGTNVCLMEITF